MQVIFAFLDPYALHVSVPAFPVELGYEHYSVQAAAFIKYMGYKEAVAAAGISPPLLRVCLQIFEVYTVRLQCCHVKDSHIKATTAVLPGGVHVATADTAVLSFATLR